MFLTKSFLTRIVTPEAGAEMDQFNLRRIHLVWTSFWKKPSNTVALNGHRTAAALRSMSMRAKRGGRTECLCSLRGRKMDCKLGLHAKGFLILGVQDGVVTQQFTTLAVWIYTHTDSST